MDQKRLYRNIGALIRSHRKSRNLTQDTLSQQIGISRAALANIEAGRQQLLVHQLYLTSHALEIPIGELLPPVSFDTEKDTTIEMQLPSDLSKAQREQILKLIRSAEAKS